MKGKSFTTARIQLACGCSVVTRNVPANERQTFICRSGMGHGYKGHAWVSWTYGERSGFNKLNQRE